MAVNTTKNIDQVETSQKDLEKQIEAAAAMLKGEKMVEVSIPKNFAKHIGPTLYLAIQGVHIVLPVDGSKHNIPKSFKDLLDDYINNLTN